MTQGMNWEKRKRKGQATEPEFLAGAQARGALSHLMREPVRVYAAEQIAAWERARHDGGHDNG